MFKFKKSLGQNFLIDKNIIEKITCLTKIEKKNILEIGPGSGNLTKFIIKKKPKTLYLIEKDNFLSEKLKKELYTNKNIKIFNTDVLKYNFEKNLITNTVIFGNLPYNISTQILIKLIKLNKWPPKYTHLIFMFQKEVAEKIIAKFNTDKYGRLSVISNWRLKVVNKFNISKNCFKPKPKVDSMILVFKPIINKSFSIKKIKNLEKITHLFFSNKRKMINKNFKNLFKNYDLIAKKLNINLSCRPSELDLNKYYKITEFYENLIEN
ncbi:MAG: 16S rRNA (adenine(1518)-N(6)/adenine(1519)-N(6))-dimethyltransferase RsmA [Pelagibacteraceae bacterium]